MSLAAMDKYENPGDDLANEARTVGAILRAARLRAGLSQRGLASKAGVSKSTVDRLEAGSVADPRWSTMQRLLEAAGQRLVMVRSEDDQRTAAIWHEWLSDRRGRHFPAHLPLLQVCFPHYDWSQGGRYMSWAYPPAPAYSYWRGPVPALRPHIMQLRLQMHLKGHCHCARLAQLERESGDRSPP